MRIEVEQQVAAPPEAVLARAADFAGFEARARRRGLPVERLADDPPAWRLGVTWHGHVHGVLLRIEGPVLPKGYRVAAEVRGIDALCVVDVALDGVQSMLSVRIDLAGRGIAGRMLMKTLGPARPVLEDRLRGALARLAAEMEPGAGAGIG
jgi:hypothetical protein